MSSGQDWAGNYSQLPDDGPAPMSGLGPGIGMSTGLGNNTTGAAPGFVERPTRQRLGEQNLDQFFTQVYAYYEGKGFWPIMLAMSLNLMTMMFVVRFSLFLLELDWDLAFNEHELHRKYTLWDLNDFTKFTFILFFLFLGFETLRTAYSFLSMRGVKHFYNHRLGIDDASLATMRWSEVMARIVAVQETLTISLVKDVLGPLDIVNRIMRLDNYMVALINRDVLDLSLPVPGLSGTRSMTMLLEWNIRLAIFGFVMDRNMNVKPEFLGRNAHIRTLAAGLRTRLLVIGTVNLLLGPFVYTFLLLYAFFRYAEEFHKSPNLLGTRQWGMYAHWVFRELNELPHIFQQRMSAAYPHASRYTKQFPSIVVTHIARFVTFIVGSFMAVLLSLSLVNDTVLSGVEVADHTIIWWLGVLGTLLAVSRSAIPDDNAVYQPERLMRHVVYHTHYMPKSWRGRCHTTAVQNEFAELYKYKVIVLLEELLSVLTTPLILCFSVAPRAEEILEFFRDYTVDVHGVGHIVAFAEFDYRVDPRDQVTRDRFFAMRHGKMAKSFLNFKANHPNWTPRYSGASLMQQLDSFARDRYSFDPETANLVASAIGATIPPNTPGSRPAPGRADATGARVPTGLGFGVADPSASLIGQPGMGSTAMYESAMTASMSLRRAPLNEDLVALLDEYTMNRDRVVAASMGDSVPPASFQVQTASSGHVHGGSSGGGGAAAEDGGEAGRAPFSRLDDAIPAASFSFRTGDDGYVPPTSFAPLGQQGAFVLDEGGDDGGDGDGAAGDGDAVPPASLQHAVPGTDGDGAAPADLMTQPAQVNVAQNNNNSNGGNRADGGGHDDDDDDDDDGQAAPDSLHVQGPL